MIPVLGRVNGQRKPTVDLQLDQQGDVVAARRALVDEASAKLQVPLGVAHEDVGVYLKGGVPMNIESVEEDDVLFFAFDGAPWRNPNERGAAESRRWEGGGPPPGDPPLGRDGPS